MAKHELRELFAFVTEDDAGYEGVVQRVTEIGTQPLIAQDLERLEQFRPFADEYAQAMRRPVRVARFVRRPS